MESIGDLNQMRVRSGLLAMLPTKARDQDMPDPQTGAGCNESDCGQQPHRHTETEQITGITDGIYPADPEIDAIGDEAEASPTADPGDMAPPTECQPNQHR